MHLAMHLSRVFKPPTQNVPSMPQDWALLIMLTSSLSKAIWPARTALSLVTGRTAQQSRLSSRGRPGDKVSVPPPPQTGHTVRQHSPTFFSHHVNDSVSPGSSGPVKFGNSRCTARRRVEHSSICRPKDNDKFFLYRAIGAKCTCRHEHDLSFYYDCDHCRRACGMTSGDIKRYASTTTSVLAPSTASAIATLSAFPAASKKGVPSHTTLGLINPMPLRLNKTSLAPKFPQLGDQPEDTVSKVRETLAPHLQALGSERDTDVVSFDGGDWNALYLVTSPGSHPILFRMSMDVTIEDKVESEIATMEFVRRHTSIPVPRVYAYDSSCNNAVGSAFILLEYVKSMRYYDVQDDLSDEEQRDIGRQVAEWCQQLRKLSFDKIGSLYLRDGGFVLGPLVCDNNPNGWRNEPSAFHGPFSSEEECYRSLWEYELRRCQGAGNTNPRSSERVEAVKGVLANIPRLASGIDLVGSSARFQHVDINENNILVDNAGKAVALIDRERANAMPSKARVPYIVEESGDPRPYHVPLKAGCYERMEELELEYLQYVFSKQAFEDSRLHLFLQGSDVYITFSMTQKYIEIRGMLYCPARRKRRWLEVSGKMRRQIDPRGTRRRKKNRHSPSGRDKSHSWYLR